MNGARLDAIVVAAGSSRRMDGLDKLDAEIGGRPILAWAIAPLAAVEEIERIVVVTAADRVERYAAAAWLPARVTAVIPGGRRRQESVAAGVRWLAAHGGEGGAGRVGDTFGGERVVLVHDGARPAASVDLVRRVAAAAVAHGAAIPVVPLVETIKEIRDGRSVATLERSHLAAAQTPQGARRGLLEAAYRRFPPDGPETWTDEAAVLEACTIPVHVVAGEPENLKVTVPADLIHFESVLAPRAAGRIGFGVDTHPFGPGRPLALGGVVFADAPRLAGHSDGDVALHAVADALLGAAALGDLGRHFPADSRTPEGIASASLLEGVVKRLAAAGYRTRSVDLTIVGSRPRLGARLHEIRTVLARLLGIAEGAVSVKASTGNLAGPEGAGRAVTAHAVAVVEQRP